MKGSEERNSQRANEAVKEKGRRELPAAAEGDIQVDEIYATVAIVIEEEIIRPCSGYGHGVGITEDPPEYVMGRQCCILYECAKCG